MVAVGIWKHLSGRELFNIVFEEFVLSDMSGTTFLTLSDIDETTFSTDHVLWALGENPSEYLRSVSIDGQHISNRLYGIFVTPEMLKRQHNQACYAHITNRVMHT